MEAATHHITTLYYNVFTSRFWAHNTNNRWSKKISQQHFNHVINLPYEILMSVFKRSICAWWDLSHHLTLLITSLQICR